MSRLLLRELLHAYPEKATYLSLMQDGKEEPYLVEENVYKHDYSDYFDYAKQLRDSGQTKRNGILGVQERIIPPWIEKQAVQENWDQKAWKRWCNSEIGLRLATRLVEGRPSRV